MNREIKFRAWDGVRIRDDFALSADGRLPFQFQASSSMPTVDRPTWKLMQYTGLHDKNGKEIYEGDIVRSIYQPLWRLGDASGEAKAEAARREQIGIVERDACNPCFVINGIDFKYPEYDFICCNLRTNEVIGNVFENPELLDAA